MKRIAILSDVHGNATALENVINDAKTSGVTEFWSLGDLVMRGPSPQECVDLLRREDNVQFIIGNHEELYGAMETITVEEIKEADDVFISMLVAYDKNYLQKETYEWLKKLPKMKTISVEDLKADIFHALPNKTWGREVSSTEKQENFNLMLENSQSDIAVFGHTHRQLIRYTNDDRLIINPGTVGLSSSNWPQLTNPKAQYAILTIHNGQVDGIDFRRVAYDVSKEYQIAKEKNLPYLELYGQFLLEGTYGYTATNISEQNQRHNYENALKKLFK